MLSRMEHPNLVTFLGFCYERNHKCLCYEVMTNGSLEHRLHGEPRFSCLCRLAISLAKNFSCITVGNNDCTRHLTGQFDLPKKLQENAS